MCAGMCVCARMLGAVLCPQTSQRWRCVLERVCVHARVLGAVLCSQPFRRCLEAASLGAPRPHGWCRRPLAGRPRAHMLTGSLSRSGGGVRERRGGQAAGAGGQVGCPGGHRAGAWNGFTVRPKPCPRGWGSGRASPLRSRVPTDLWVALSGSETSRVRFHSSAGRLIVSVLIRT